MKLAVVGSRKLTNIVLDTYVSKEVKEIVSGGAAGVDLCAAEYARKNKLKLTEFLPEYKRYGRAAPIIRNKRIVEYADKIIVMRKGKIIESGTHQELLAHEGHYFDLYKLQYRGNNE